ncbi:MAG: hypothetical protein ABIG46_07310, partial [Candidatus Omnitrophota bacterium]
HGHIINGGTSNGRSGNREIIVVNFERDRALQEFYRDIKSRFEDRIRTDGLSGEDKGRLVKGIYDAVIEQIKYDDVAIERLAQEYKGKEVLIGNAAIIPGKGVCRHQGIISAAILERFIQERLLKGQVYYVRGPEHGWAVYRTSTGEFYVMDVAQEYFGPMEGKEYHIGIKAYPYENYLASSIKQQISKPALEGTIIPGFGNQNRQEKKQPDLTQTETFNKLYEVLDLLGGLQGLNRYYDTKELKLIIEEIRQLVHQGVDIEVVINRVTRTSGLRDKVKELVKNEVTISKFKPGINVTLRKISIKDGESSEVSAGESLRGNLLNDIKEGEQILLDSGTRTSPVKKIETAGEDKLFIHTQTSIYEVALRENRGQSDIVLGVGPAEIFVRLFGHIDIGKKIGDWVKGRLDKKDKTSLQAGPLATSRVLKDVEEHLSQIRKHPLLKEGDRFGVRIFPDKGRGISSLVSGMHIFGIRIFPDKGRWAFSQVAGINIEGKEGNRVGSLEIRNLSQNSFDKYDITVTQDVNLKEGVAIRDLYVGEEQLTEFLKARGFWLEELDKEVEESGMTDMWEGRGFVVKDKKDGNIKVIQYGRDTVFDIRGGKHVGWASFGHVPLTDYEPLADYHLHPKVGAVEPSDHDLELMVSQGYPSIIFAEGEKGGFIGKSYTLKESWLRRKMAQLDVALLVRQDKLSRSQYNKRINKICSRYFDVEEITDIAQSLTKDSLLKTEAGLTKEQPPTPPAKSASTSTDEQRKDRQGQEASEVDQVPASEGLSESESF